jgi:hypothetical protein
LTTVIWRLALANVPGGRANFVIQEAQQFAGSFRFRPLNGRQPFRGV